MTAITLNLPDDIAQKVKDTQNPDAFVTPAIRKQLEEDNEDGIDYPVPAYAIKRFEEGKGQPGNREGYMEIDECIALRRAKPEEDYLAGIVSILAIRSASMEPLTQEEIDEIQ